MGISWPAVIFKINYSHVLMDGSNDRNLQIHVKLPQGSIPRHKTFGTQTKYRESSMQTELCSHGDPGDESIHQSLSTFKYKEDVQSVSDKERIHSYRMDFRNIPEHGDISRIPTERKLLAEEEEALLQNSFKVDVSSQRRSLRHLVMSKQITDWSNEGHQIEKERLSRLLSRKEDERIARNREWNRYRRKEVANFEAKKCATKRKLKNKTSSGIDRRVKDMMNKMEITFAKAPSAKRLPMLHKFSETPLSDEEDVSFLPGRNPKEDRYDALLNSAFDDLMAHRHKENVDNYRRHSAPTDHTRSSSEDGSLEIIGDDELRTYLDEMNHSSLGIMFDRIMERLLDVDGVKSDHSIIKDLESIASTMIDGFVDSLIARVIHKAPETSKQIPCEENRRPQSGLPDVSLSKRRSSTALKMRAFQEKCLSIAHDKFWSCLLHIRKDRNISLIDTLQFEDSLKAQIDENIWKSDISTEIECAFQSMKLA